jgi:hypothetical protein
MGRSIARASASAGQAQLSYSSVGYDDFVDTFGAAVSLQDAVSLQGRLGISVSYEDESTDASGRVNRSTLYDGAADPPLPFRTCVPAGCIVELRSTRSGSKASRTAKCSS